VRCPFTRQIRSSGKPSCPALNCEAQVSQSSSVLWHVFTASSLYAAVRGSSRREPCVVPTRAKSGAPANHRAQRSHIQAGQAHGSREQVWVQQRAKGDHSLEGPLSVVFTCSLIQVYRLVLANDANRFRLSFLPCKARCLQCKQLSAQTGYGSPRCCLEARQVLKTRKRQP